MKCVDLELGGHFLTVDLIIMLDIILDLSEEILARGKSGDVQVIELVENIIRSIKRGCETLVVQQ